MHNELNNFIIALHNRHSTSMIQLAYRLTGDSYMAEDMVQETFLIAWFKANELYQHENPKGWLYKTLSFLIMRENGRAYHSSEIPLDEQRTSDTDNMHLPLGFNLPKGLSEKERNLIIMRFEKQLSYEEIAENKGITQAACRKQMSRAIKKCRNLIK